MGFCTSATVTIGIKVPHTNFPNLNKECFFYVEENPEGDTLRCIDPDEEKCYVIPDTNTREILYIPYESVLSSNEKWGYSSYGDSITYVDVEAFALSLEKINKIRQDNDMNHLPIVIVNHISCG